MFKNIRKSMGTILMLLSINGIAAEKDSNKPDKENENPRNIVIILFKSNGYTPPR